MTTKSVTLVVACLVVALVSGCQNDGCHRSCGFHFEILKPPTITVATPILVQSGGPQLGAHPMGTVAGPVVEGQFSHAPAALPAQPRQPMPSAPAAAPPPSRMQPIIVPGVPRRQPPMNNCNTPCAGAEEEAEMPGRE